MQHEHALLKDSTGVFHIAQRCVDTSSIKPSLILLSTMTEVPAVWMTKPWLLEIFLNYNNDKLMQRQCKRRVDIVKLKQSNGVEKHQWYNYFLSSEMIVRLIKPTSITSSL